MPRALAAMPIADPTPAKVEPTPVPAPPVEADAGEGVVKYPELEVRIYTAQSERGPVDFVKMREFLGWEDEPEFAARVGATMSEADRLTNPPGYADEYDFLDMNKAKVKLWNNQGNRDFIREHALSLAQDVLTRNWADSRNGGVAKFTLEDGRQVDMTEMTINGETIIITRTGKTDSGQHRGIGFIFACQIWAKGEVWKGIDPRALWPEMPTMEALVVFGVSDSDRVTMTLDNVMPRTEADTISTSLTFAGYSRVEKKELSRMLAYATDLLWNRTGVGKQAYQTHSTSKDFRRRHPLLEKCVLHVFGENKKRAISRLKLSPGHVSALMYLMAASAGDPKSYNEADTWARDDSLIDFTAKVTVAGKKKEAWKAAELFVSLLAAAGTEKGDRTLFPIAEEIFRIQTDTEKGASTLHKNSIVCIAWNMWSSDQPVLQDDLKIEFAVRDDGTKYIAEAPNVGGIDRPADEKPDDGEDPTPEKVEKVKKEKKESIKKQNAEATKNLVKEAADRRKGIPQQYLALQGKHPDKLLLWRTPASWSTYGPSAERLVAALGLPKPTPSPDGITRAFVTPGDLPGHLPKLQAAGVTPCFAEDGGKGKGMVVRDSPTGGPATAPPAAPTPAANGQAAVARK